MTKSYAPPAGDLLAALRNEPSAALRDLESEWIFGVACGASTAGYTDPNPVFRISCESVYLVLGGAKAKEKSMTTKVGTAYAVASGLISML